MVGLQAKAMTFSSLLPVGKGDLSENEITRRVRKGRYMGRGTMCTHIYMLTLWIYHFRELEA